MTPWLKNGSAQGLSKVSESGVQNGFIVASSVSDGMVRNTLSERGRYTGKILKNVLKHSPTPRKYRQPMGRMGDKNKKKGFGSGFLCASVSPWLKEILHCGVQNVSATAGWSVNDNLNRMS